MTLSPLGRLAFMLAVTLTLAGCVDMSVDVAVTSETTARATLTQVMSAEVYPMIKASDADKAGDDAASDEDRFCAEGRLSENEDGSATCEIVTEGRFEDLDFDEAEGRQAVTFTAAGPGLVRVAFDTKDIGADIGESGGEELDDETKKMMEAYFQGHYLTFRVSGTEVTDTNMDISEDKVSAEKKVHFVDLLNGKTDLPDELYAVVRVK